MHGCIAPWELQASRRRRKKPKFFCRNARGGCGVEWVRVRRDATSQMMPLGLVSDIRSRKLSLETPRSGGGVMGRRCA
jgi:hypothetical protein